MVGIRLGHIFIAWLLAGWLIGPAAARAASLEIAVLQGLDKTTARVSTFEVPVGQSVRFGSLEIYARICDKRPPEEAPESAAFLDISELRQGQPAAQVYRGWMFASSPALAAMEHAVYDIWVIDCKNPSSNPASSSGAKSE